MVSSGVGRKGEGKGRSKGKGQERTGKVVEETSRVESRGKGNGRSRGKKQEQGVRAYISLPLFHQSTFLFFVH